LRLIKLMRYRATVHLSIAEISEDEWQSILDPGTLFHSYPWMAFLEQNVLGDYSPRYIVFRDEAGRLVGHASAYLIDTSLLIFARGILKSILSWVRIPFPRFMKTRVVECGCPIGATECVALGDDVRFEDIAEALNRALDSIAIAERSWLMVIRDFSDETRTTASILLRNGYAEMANIALVEIPVRWSTFEEYTDSMRARYRKLLRKRLRVAREAGISSTIEEDFQTDAVVLAEQRKYVADRAREYGRESVTPEFYRLAQKIFGRNAKIVRITNAAGQMISHSLVIADGPVLHALQFGRSPNTEDLGAYFLVTADIVRLGIDLGCRTIDLGLSTHSPKLEFGGTMVPLWMFVKIKGRLGSLIVRLLRSFNAVPRKEERRVFR
jgi:predicted N-acyltransferase